MSDQFSELFKFALTVFFIMIMIMIGKIFYNINQINDYNKEVQQLVQKNGGITDGRIKVSGNNANNKPIYTANVLDKANKKFSNEYYGYFKLIPAPNATGKEKGVPSLAEINCDKSNATETQINHPNHDAPSAYKKEYDRGKFDTHASASDKAFARKIDNAYTKQRGYWQDNDGYYHITLNEITVSVFNKSNNAGILANKIHQDLTKVYQFKGKDKDDNKGKLLDSARSGLAQLKKLAADSNSTYQDLKPAYEKLQKAYDSLKGISEHNKSITKEKDAIEDNLNAGETCIDNYNPDVPNQYGRILKYQIKSNIPTIHMFNLHPQIHKINLFQTTSQLEVNGEDN